MPTTNWRLTRSTAQARPLQRGRRYLRDGRVGDVRWRERRYRSLVRVAIENEDPWVAAFEWRLPNTSAFMFRRSALTRAGQWDESVQVCTDYDLYFRLLLAGATLKAAPNAMSLYRHWSVAQAVHVNPLSRVSTRLRLLNRAAEALATTDRMTERRRHAFEQSALKCIRSLYHFDRERAQDAFNKLLAWNDQVAPLSSEFARLYVLAFRLGGLDVAETIATWGRRVRKPSAPGCVTNRFRSARPNDWSWSASSSRTRVTCERSSGDANGYRSSR